MIDSYLNSKQSTKGWHILKTFVYIRKRAHYIHQNTLHIHAHSNLNAKQEADNLEGRGRGGGRREGGGGDLVHGFLAVTNQGDNASE